MYGWLVTPEIAYPRRNGNPGTSYIVRRGTGAPAIRQGWYVLVYWIKVRKSELYP
jgi:hypothetical protein